MEFKVPRDNIEEIFGEDRKLNIDKIKGENIKYGPVLIDTVTFTFRHVPLEKIFEWMSPFGFDFQLQKDSYGMPKKFNSFSRYYVDKLTHSVVAVDMYTMKGYEDLIYLSITGKGCSVLNSKGKMIPLLKVFNAVDVLGIDGAKAKCSRIDIAKDCFTNLFDFIEGNQSNDYKRLKRFGIGQKQSHSYVSRDRFGNAVSGWTWYFGKRGTSTFVRLYDKRRESKVEKDLDHWVRLEFEMRNAGNTKSAQFATDIWQRLCAGDSLNHIFYDYCMQSFIVYPENDIELDDPNRTHKLKPDPSFLEFVEDDSIDDFGSLVFCEQLRAIPYLRKCRNSERLLPGLVARVFHNMTHSEILSAIDSYVNYSHVRDAQDYGVDYVYYSDPGGDYMEDVPFLPVAASGCEDIFQESMKNVEFTL